MRGSNAPDSVVPVRFREQDGFSMSRGTFSLFVHRQSQVTPPPEELNQCTAVSSHDPACRNTRHYGLYRHVVRLCSTRHRFPAAQHMYVGIIERVGTTDGFGLLRYAVGPARHL